MTRTLWRHAALATLAPTSSPARPYGLLTNGALIAEGGTIVWVGSDDAIPADTRVESEHDLQGGLLTPGLIDAHTHLVYGGNRAAEFEQRLHGVSYADIARAGGGIASTVRATREASTAQLTDLAVLRARALMAEGVTTVEIKSGYGLSAADERRSLEAARAVGARLPVTVRTTSLALHALPPEYAGRPDDYVDAACEWLREQHAHGLVDAVDAFCEHIAFTPDQVARVFAVARALGLPVKLHAEQLSDSKGAVMAASYGALSCDHLEYLGVDGIAAMRAHGTVAMLLPGAYYFLRESQLPPVAALREAGVPIAIATDHNPGSSPTLSLPLMMNMACTLFRLTPEECWRGVTLHAARALGLTDRGMLASGMRADLAIWDAEHPRDVTYAFGRHACRMVVVNGTECVS